jgi:hypothetical protein
MRTRFTLVTLIIAGLLGLASSVSPAAAQQVAAPARPLLLIGGTFVGQDSRGYLDPATGAVIVAGWADVVRWLQNEGGYREGENLFIGEMKRQVAVPPGWTQPEWDQFVATLASYGGTTAGLAPMAESVTQVKNLIYFYSTGLGTKIDVIGHSQAGPVIRAAIKQIEQENPSLDPVHTMISLGGANYGITTQAPEFQLDIGIPILEFWANLFTEVTMADCRDTGWLPVCPDIIRHRGGPVTSPPVIPDPNNPDPSLYQTAFFPNLNSAAGVGPVPGGTTYHHLYSYIFAGDGGLSDVETQASEAIELFPNRPNVRNQSVQAFCQDPFELRGYVLHHINEWVDPAMREMMLGALGVRAANPNVC